MKRFFTVKYLLIAITLLAAVLRLWQLGVVPPSPDWDEAALGYNAYSILHTGKDEYGNFLPIVLRSFDDYKPALYAYILIPFIKVLGLSVFAVRLPSALFGIIAVVVSYFLVKEITKRNDLALLTAFLLAISPWHIQFSRTAFEASSGVLLNMLMALFFLKGLKKPWFFLGSVISGGLSIYMYQSEKVFTPLLFLLLVGLFYKELRKVSLKYIAISLLVGLVVVLPMGVYIVTNSNSLNRATRTVSFGDEKTFLRQDSQRQLDDRATHDILGELLDNRRLVYLNAITSGYLAHFDLNWLFLKGDAARHHAPGMGLMYLIELPFLLLGIYFFVFSKTLQLRYKWLIFAWLLITPIPASLGSDVPHAVRTMNFLPMLQLLVAGGIMQGIGVVKQTIRLNLIRNMVYAIVVFLFVFNFVYYLDQYFVQLNYFTSQDWQYGYQSMMQDLQKVDNNYQHIIISEKYPLDQSYIFVLFYSKFPPQEFQNAMEIVERGNYDHRQFGNYVIRAIDWGNDKNLQNTLLVGSPAEFPKDIRTRYTIKYLDGKIAIEIVDPQDNTNHE